MARVYVGDTMKYTSYGQLSGNILKLGDSLFFRTIYSKTTLTTLNYEVRNCYLEGNDISNDKIFGVLGIKDKNVFCSSAYGYKYGDGLFPQCRDGDFPALTRVALELFKRCDRYNIILLE